MVSKILLNFKNFKRQTFQAVDIENETIIFELNGFLEKNEMHAFGNHKRIS